MIGEVWAKTFDDSYEVSSLGRVRSVDRIVVYSDGRSYFYRGVIRKLSLSPNGYVQVNFSRRSRELVHRLVGVAFIPNPLNLPEINHKDGDKLNNKVNNLEWATSSFNKRHALETGLRKAGPRMSTEDIAKVRYYSKEGKSGVEIAKMFNISTATVSKIINHKGAFQ